uniref:RAS and EF-hand domain containing n=1 Tax=Sphaeramia orbicularis TaxID=375764 RepID=A0A673CCP7_9TELE
MGLYVISVLMAFGVRLSSLFHAYDVDNSGRIEKNEFFTICQELHVSSKEADGIFDRLDIDKDGTVTLEEFISGFNGQHREEEEEDEIEQEDMDGGEVSAAWEDFEMRLADQAKFIPRNNQAAMLYQNISLTEPRLIAQFEKVIMNFTKEIRQQNSEMENLALAIKRAQDQASMQLSEMEEEMDQRIHAAERKTRDVDGVHLLCVVCVELRRSYETEVCELQCKIQRMQMIEEKYKNITVNDESPALKKKINELMLENQRLKQELLKSQTNVACLQSDMDSLKTELTDQSINSERKKIYIYIPNMFLPLCNRTANRKLHDSNDGLRATLEKITRVKFYQRMDDIPVYSRRPSCDTLALAMCDPGLRRRDSSECEEDSLPEVYMDSGLSTLRGSHGGYDSEFDTKCPEEEEEEEEEVEERQKKKQLNGTEVRLKVQQHKNTGSLSAISDERDRSGLDYMASEKTYRIVLAGDAAVGKSSFMLRLCKNEFKSNSSATLGVDFQMKTLIVDGEPALLQIWDTAGQERFRSIAKSYFRRADGVLLLYDVTCQKSFLNVREWVDMIEEVSQENIPMMLVGNKSDLRKDGVNCVPTSYGEKLSMTYSTLFCETSAKDGSNVLEAVLHLKNDKFCCFSFSV